MTNVDAAGTLDQQHKACFGSHAGISQSYRLLINQLKDVDSHLKMLTLHDTGNFTDLAWELIGRYLSLHNHLKKVRIHGVHQTNVVAAIFRGWQPSGNGKAANRQLCLSLNSPSENMIPLFGEAGSLHIQFTVSGVRFNELITSLNGRPIKYLNLTGCLIQNISALEQNSLPNLASLDLTRNGIGREGSIVIANMLQRDECRLQKLVLDSAGICDEEAVIIADALKHNKTLGILSLENFHSSIALWPNDIREKGSRALLAAVCDIRSIDHTYRSNHTMISIQLHSGGTPMYVNMTVWMGYVMTAINEDRKNESIATTGRKKVVMTQLKRKTREALSRLQGVDDSHAKLFADINPLVLPEVYALISQYLDLSELYQMLIDTVPDLTSIVGRRGIGTKAADGRN